MDLRAALVGACATAVVLVAAACADDGPSQVSAADPAEGRRIARDAGCAACHGADGEGGIGPPYVGLHGSVRELRDGSTVHADEEYLVRSIVDPQAEIVAGYLVPMPRIELDEAELAAVVAYIKDLGDET